MVTVFLLDQMSSLPKICIQSATLLPLIGNANMSLLGPIYSKSIDEHSRVRNKVRQPDWHLLIGVCATFDIMPPTIEINQPAKRGLIK